MAYYKARLCQAIYLKVVWTTSPNVCFYVSESIHYYQLDHNSLLLVYFSFLYSSSILILGKPNFILLHWNYFLKKRYFIILLNRLEQNYFFNKCDYNFLDLMYLYLLEYLIRFELSVWFLRKQISRHYQNFLAILLKKLKPTIFLTD